MHSISWQGVPFAPFSTPLHSLSPSAFVLMQWVNNFALSNNRNIIGLTTRTLAMGRGQLNDSDSVKCIIFQELHIMADFIIVVVFVGIIIIVIIAVICICPLSVFVKCWSCFYECFKWINDGQLNGVLREVEREVWRSSMREFLKASPERSKRKRRKWRMN